MSADSTRELYLDLLKRSLRGDLYPDLDGTVWPSRLIFRKLVRALVPASVRMYRQIPEAEKQDGTGWPTAAKTLLGVKRMDNVQFCVEDVIARGVPGDLIETGVWRGGTVILMRAILKAHQVTDRKVWVADSFAGLPKPDARKFPADAGDVHYLLDELAIPLEEVQANFRLYGLLDDQVGFLKGWFKDTLPSAPIEKLAVARLDGDMYQSTIEALETLYPKLSVGGYLIVDDYVSAPRCKKAVEDFRKANQINDPIQEIDLGGAFWQRRT